MQQIFRLAHKREKLTAFSQANERLNEAQFNDLMRILRHQLRSDFFALVNIETKISWFAGQISGFSQLVNSVSEQVTKGNMAQKDLVRLQSQLRSLQRDLAELEQSRIPVWADVQVLLGEKEMLLGTERDFQLAKEEYQRSLVAIDRISEVQKMYGGSNSGGVMPVVAPASGYLVEKKISAGSVIRADNSDNLFTIGDINDVWVMANVFESDIARVRTGLEVDIKTLAYPNKIFKGKIEKLATCSTR